MDSQQIKAFIDAMAASDLDEMQVSHDGWTLRLVRGSRAVRSGIATAAAPMPAASEPLPVPAAAAPSLDEVRAPLFGIVHLQQGPGEPPFVSVGDVIEAGRMLCTIEAMKVFNEVRAERGG